MLVRRCKPPALVCAMNELVDSTHNCETSQPPPLMQIHHEPLSGLLHLAHVKRLHTSSLMGERSSSRSHKDLDEELQAM
ncbi:hypothetical protein YC2023_068455 [Brassica napus]